MLPGNRPPCPTSDRSRSAACRPTMLRCTFFFFNDTATTEIYTLSLHDALPISCSRRSDAPKLAGARRVRAHQRRKGRTDGTRDRKSTRLNSSHSQISYAVFCLKKKKEIEFAFGVLSGLGLANASGKMKTELCCG